MKVNASNPMIFQVRLAASSGSLWERVQDLLRSLRDTFFSPFLTINAGLEQQLRKEVSGILSQLKKVSKDKTYQVFSALPSDAYHFVESGMRLKLANEKHPLYGQYHRVQKYFFDHAGSKEVQELLKRYDGTRADLIDLAPFIPYVQNRHTPKATLLQRFGKLSSPLQQKILLTLAKIEDPSSATQARGRLLLTQRTDDLFRTAIATAVRGLKTHDDPENWYAEAWRCKFWYA